MLALGYRCKDSSPGYHIYPAMGNTTRTTTKPQAERSVSLSLRHDINEHSDVKVQLDRSKDLSRLRALRPTS